MNSLLLEKTMFLRRRDWFWNESPFISIMLTGSITIQQSSTGTITLPVELLPLPEVILCSCLCHAVSLTQEGSGPCLRGCLTNSVLSWSVLMEEAGRMSPGHEDGKMHPGTGACVFPQFSFLEPFDGNKPIFPHPPLLYLSWEAAGKGWTEWTEAGIGVVQRGFWGEIVACQEGNWKSHSWGKREL